MFKKIESKKIKIGDQDYNYNLRRKRYAKYVRLTIEHDGTLSVTAPVTYPMFFIKKFLASRAIWLQKNLKKITDNPTILGIKHSEAQIKEYKKQARLLVEDRINYYNQFYNLEVRRISIRNQKSRWGSCSSKKYLNFNYRLALIDRDLADYIIVHELCHLAEMNHSRAFWKLVEHTIPDYKNRKKLLKKI